MKFEILVICSLLFTGSSFHEVHRTVAGKGYSEERIDDENILQQLFDGKPEKREVGNGFGQTRSERKKMMKKKMNEFKPGN